MAIVRLEALRQLEAAIGCAIPILRDRICVGQADAGEELEFPSLVIDPVRWAYNPFQADEVHEPAPDRVVVNVGYHQGTVQLRLGAKTAFERYKLEQAIIDVFLSTPLHPGVLLTPVTACEKLGEFVAAWELEDDSWEDEAAFDQQFYSVVVVTGTIPALVTRGGAHTIEDLKLGLTDFSTTVNASTFATSPGVEVVTINADGSISPA